MFRKMFHCRTRSLVSFVTNDNIEYMCLSFSYPNFLLQKPFAHKTESCVEISAFIFLLQKSGKSDNSVCTVSQTLWLYKHVNSRSHDSSARWFLYLSRMSWNVLTPQGPIMSFTYSIFPVIRSVNKSTFPWCLMWLLFHNTGIEWSWQFKSSNLFHTRLLKVRGSQLQPFKSMTSQIWKETQAFVSKGSKNIFRNITPFTERLRLEQTSNPLQQKPCLHLF